MSTTIWRGGIPTDPDIRKLREKWPTASLTQGLVITDDEVAKVIAPVKPKTSRWRTVTDRWRRIVMRESGVIIGRIEGTYRVLTDAEKVELMRRKVRTSRTYGLAAIAIGTTVDLPSLTAEQRAMFDHQNNCAAAIKLSTATKGLEVAQDM